MILGEVSNALCVYDWETIYYVLQEYEEYITYSGMKLIKDIYKVNYTLIIDSEIDSIDDSEDLSQIIELVKELNQYFGIDGDKEIQMLIDRFNELLKFEKNNLTEDFIDEDQFYEEYRDIQLYEMYEESEDDMVENMFESFFDME